MGTVMFTELAARRGRNRLVSALRGVAVLGLCAYAAYSLTGGGGHTLEDVFENWIFNGLLFLSAALCLLRAAWLTQERTAWAVLGLGLACWGLGEVVYTLDPAQVTAGTFPGTSDFLWLAFYPAAFLTLGLLVRARVRQFYPSLWLDGLVGALVTAALASQFVLPKILAGTGGSLSSVVGDLIYPQSWPSRAGVPGASLAPSPWGWRWGRQPTSCRCTWLPRAARARACSTRCGPLQRLSSPSRPGSRHGPLR
jgi:hypothetical protein